MNDVAHPTNLLDRIGRVVEWLVETGNRNGNRFIHVDRAAKRANVLNIPRERSDDIFDLLRTQGKRMRFRPREEEGPGEEAEADGPSLAVYLDDEDGADRGTGYRDLFLETRLGPEALQRRLLRLFLDARTAEEERGVNILYLALGFLRWYKSDNSDVLHESPLILLPVGLARDGRGTTFNLRARDTELLTNMPLQKRLRADFGLELPEIEEDDAFSPEKYFDKLTTRIKAHPQWAIDRDGIQLGFFSFSKFLMVQDLEPENWPPGTFETHPILGGLLGDGFERSEPLFGPQERLDPRLAPANLLHVVPADASQTRAIEEVRAGHNLVVQGPPGTGKSQTIANFIAAAVQDGKKVLFVAEKMAALSVVHDRLKKVGLGDPCIEIHSRAANKRAFLAELERTLVARVTMPKLPGPPDALTKARDWLNEVSDLLHSPVPGYTFTPFRTMAEIVRFIGRKIPPPRIPRDGLADLNEDARQRLATRIAEYATLLVQAGPRAKHPFTGVGATALQPTELQRLKPELARAVETLAALQRLTARLSQTSGHPLPETLLDCAQLHQLLSAAADRPEVGQDAASALLPKVKAKRLFEALEAGKAWAESREAAAKTFTEGAFETAPDDLRTRLAPGVSSVLARLFGGYRAASRELASLLAGPLPKSPEDRLALLGPLVTVQRRREALSDEEGWLSELLGTHWRGERTPFAALQIQASWLYRISRITPITESEAIDRLCVAAPDAAEIEKVLKTANEILDGLQSRLSISWKYQSLEEMSGRVGAMHDGFDRYTEWARLATLAKNLESEGFETLLSFLDEGSVELPGAVDEFLYATAEARWNVASAALPALDELAHLDRYDLVTEFRDLEGARLEQTRLLVRAKHRDQVPRGTDGQMAFLRGEMAKKRGHKPIRQIMKRAGEMVQRIKPVLLMSPISIAQYLPPGSVEFDLLVIDEASQVRPEEALGAVLRCRQIVVVGDQKQLPPTSFFDHIAGPEEETEDEDEEGEIEPVGAAELESILTLCDARGLNPVMLEWHYRSRDPSLIAVNNAEFYEHRLILPPSSTQNDPDSGLTFRQVPGVYSSRSRGPGRPGTNRIEAEAIVSEIAKHARARPDLSLGVVAFSKAQSDMLTEVLEHARRKDQNLDAFLREERTEDVFVKNIENVQGDERDVILISVGYGPSEAGGRLASMSFGPVNAEGGERRLNVLFSRARTRCLVFCSFDPNDIDVSRTRRDGPRVLKKFLEFARSGQIAQPEATGDPADSPFEEDVAEVIRGLGYSCDHQVGAAGFKIDLGVRHPKQPGRYILAVECDGATYHSALWARERDRLRQDVLEGLGWQFHRVWSTDWFYRRGDAIDRLRSALDGAALEVGTAFSGTNAGGRPPALVEEPTHAPEAVPLPLPALRVPAYVPSAFKKHTSLELHLVETQILAELVAKIVDAEGPIHKDLVARRVVEAFGKGGAGKRIKAKCDRAIREAKRSRSILFDDTFAMTSAQQAEMPVRNRSGEDAPKKAEWLPPAEIRTAAAQVVAESGEMQRDELIVATARLLGFGRLGQELRGAIDRALPSGQG